VSAVTYYRVICDRHTPPLVLVDITCDPDCEAFQHHERQVARWDRHASGEQPELDRSGRSFPRGFRPYLYRDSSRTITVYPHEHMFFAELVDRSGPREINEWLEERAEAAVSGQEPPRRHDGYVRVVEHEIGEVEHTDGHEIRIACDRCKQGRGKALLAFASAGTLAIVLDRVGTALPSEVQPVYDQTSGKLTGETVDVRVITLYELRKALGGNPRGPSSVL